MEYLRRVEGFRKSGRLLVFFGGKQPGSALTPQRLSGWLRDGTILAYEFASQVPPTGIRAHSTRGTASSVALLRVSAEDICTAASGTSTSTFTRSYLVDVSAKSAAHAIWGGAGQAPLRHAEQRRGPEQGE